MRPVGHVTDLIRELKKWKKNRERIDTPRRRGLDTKPLDMAINYLIEYRAFLAVLPVGDPKEDNDWVYLEILDRKMNEAEQLIDLCYKDKEV